MAGSSRILVCQSNSCRRRGSEAVLLEIEELANAVEAQCSVAGSGCLGYCSQAPAAVVVQKRRQDTYFTRIDSLQDSEKIVIAATGKKPPTDDPNIQTRLAGVRQLRAREHAVSVYRWNEALQATRNLMESATSNSDGRAAKEQRQIYRELLSKAGFLSERALPTSSSASFQMPKAIEKYSQWLLHAVTIVSHHSAIYHFRSDDIKRGTPNPRGGGRSRPTPKTWHTTLLAETRATASDDVGPLPWIERDYTPISGAKQWEQGRCDILIKIYQQGQATSWLHRVAQSHYKNFQQQHSASSNSPSQAASSVVMDEEDAVQHQPPTELRVWLSQPVPTLTVPSLVPAVGGAANPRPPASVLLLLAGTGVVALPQILHQRDPMGKIGMAMKRSEQLHNVPVDLVLSCRSDDVLYLPDIVQYCREGAAFHEQKDQNSTSNNNNNRRVTAKGLRHVSLLLTEASCGTGDASTGSSPSNQNGATSSETAMQKTNYWRPFPTVPSATTEQQQRLLQELDSDTLPNARVLERQRLSQELVTHAVSRMQAPCRVVVSGPSGFNSAAREMLLQLSQNGNPPGTGLMLEEDDITILEA